VVAISTSDPELLGSLLRQLRAQGRLSPRKAAPLLGRHYLTLLDYIRQGKVRTIVIGDRHYITEEEIIRFRTQGNWVDPEAEDEGGEAAQAVSFPPSYSD
jgi:hypothetical protein